MGVTVRGISLWLALSAPMSSDPMQRHDQARIRLLFKHADGWSDGGNLLPDGFAHGSREWAGVGWLDQHDIVHLLYTAAGVRGEDQTSYRQRIFSASANFDRANLTFRDWLDRGEVVQSDGTIYAHADQLQGAAGSIKAFRDPWHFVDRHDDSRHLLFSGTSANSVSKLNAVIGWATFDTADQQWQIKQPLLEACEVTNEIERPHVICHEGLYYLFWSCHGWTFGPDLDAPTGLYGMVADSLKGPYEPLNDNGLVVCNPSRQPFQAYSWWVANDLTVSSFVDLPTGEIHREAGAPNYPVGDFAGVFAPEFRLQLHGRTAHRIDE